jgi:hypothetical protein
MIGGSALTAAFVNILAEGHAQSLVDGRVIPLTEYARTFDSRSFAPLFSIADLTDALGGKITSPRLFANVVLLPPSDLYRASEKQTAREFVLSIFEQATDRSSEVLTSQLLPPGLSVSLRRGDVLDFLVTRAEFIAAEIEKHFDIKKFATRGR